MRNYKTILFLLIVAVFMFALAGCNNTSVDTTVPDTTASADVSTTAEVTATEEALAQEETSAVYFTTEADDLEIMTALANDSDNNDSEDKGEETPATNAVIETQPENDKDNKEETAIELPFIPAN